MGVVWVREVWEGTGGQLNERGFRTYTRTFRVATDPAATGPLEVLLAASIPRMFDFYIAQTEYDLGATVRTITPTRDSDNPLRWTVRVEYSSEYDPVKAVENPLQNTDSQQAGRADERNPLLRPADYRWAFKLYQIAIQQDLDGKHIMNAADEYFDPPVEVDDYRPVLTIVRNEPTYIPTLAIQYQNAINEDFFIGAAPLTVKFNGSQAESVFENNFFYWKITYEFEYKRDGWRRKLLNQGYRQKLPNGAGGFYYLPIENNGLPITSPVPLLTNGQRLVIPPGVPNYLEFKVYKELPFSVFQFP